MPTIALSGNDSVILNNRPIVDLADETVAELTYPNEIASVKTGKNGNSIFGYNTSGRQSDLKLRLIRGSNDDKFLNNLLTQQNNAFEQTVLMIGEFIKVLGDGAGGISNDIYITSGGVFVKQVEAKSNVSGDTEQSVAIYEIKFSNTIRAIT